MRTWCTAKTWGWVGGWGTWHGIVLHAKLLQVVGVVRVVHPLNL